MKKTLYILFMIFLVAGAIDVALAGPVEPVKKCKTCGKPLSLCPGHNTTKPKKERSQTKENKSKQKSAVKKCKACGKPLAECPYEGEHPQELTQAEINRILKELEDNMVYVEGGTFAMGDAGTFTRGDGVYMNKGKHQVKLTGYLICKYEVTQELWYAVMGENRVNYEKANSSFPVEGVCYKECQNFITKINALTGKCYRLPTEAEWEFAACGGIKSKGYRYSGSNNIDDVAWNRNNSNQKTHPVGTKSPNELGLYDMSGNVLEWCQDWYADYPSEAQDNPAGPDEGTKRVARGGDYINSVYVNYRWALNPHTHNTMGLRLALSDN